MRTQYSRNNNSINENNGLNKAIAIGVLKELQGLGIDVSTEDKQRPILFWLKSKEPRVVNEFMLNENPCNLFARSYLEYLRQKNRGVKSPDTRVKKVRTAVKRKEEVYNDVNLRQDTHYDSKRMKNITMKNININESQIYFDSFFAKESNSYYTYVLNNREQYSIETKSTPFKIKNVKAIESGDFFIPGPTNVGLNGEILRLDISEFSNMANREYPNNHFIFEYAVEAFGSRYRLKPLKPFYKLCQYINELSSFTLRFYLQNLALVFPAASAKATLVYSNPMVFNKASHGLLNGDKISVYQYEGSIDINSVHSVTVINPNSFSIPVNALSATGLSSVIYYVLKNKMECNFTLYCI